MQDFSLEQKNKEDATDVVLGVVCAIVIVVGLGLIVQLKLDASLNTAVQVWIHANYNTIGNIVGLGMTAVGCLVFLASDKSWRSGWEFNLLALTSLASAGILLAQPLMFSQPFAKAVELPSLFHGLPVGMAIVLLFYFFLPAILLIKRWTMGGGR